MGRTKAEGSKQIARQLDNPRFQVVQFSNGKAQLKVLIATGSYDRIVAGFEKRGFKVGGDL